MLEFLKETYSASAHADPLAVGLRLLSALILGLIVAWVYRRTRKSSEITASFPTTLVLLAILIAMVTQVIGDNVARAFSLVGALSIVRFRTVVRDTQDTAYVIFAVVVGMAVGAGDLAVSLIGIGIVALAAFVLMLRKNVRIESTPEYILNLRIEIEHDVETLLGPLLNKHLEERELISIGTAKQGVSLDISYRIKLSVNIRADDFLKMLNQTDGVQSVELKRNDIE
jgi:energy-converting hydrogenase Eha subunit A